MRGLSNSCWGLSGARVIEDSDARADTDLSVLSQSSPPLHAGAYSHLFVRGHRSLDFLVVVATRDVAAGDELSISYGEAWAGDGSGGGGAGGAAEIVAAIGELLRSFFASSSSSSSSAGPRRQQLGASSSASGQQQEDGEEGGAKGRKKRATVILRGVPRAPEVMGAIAGYFGGRRAWRVCYKQCEVASYAFPSTGLGRPGQARGGDCNATSGTIHHSLLCYPLGSFCSSRAGTRHPLPGSALAPASALRLCE